MGIFGFIILGNVITFVVLTIKLLKIDWTRNMRRSVDALVEKNEEKTHDKEE